jgi:glutaredoxin
LLSDFYPHGYVAQRYGVLRVDGTSERALFIVDRQGVIRYIDIHDINEQPDNEVLFHELDKLEPEGAAAWALAQQAKIEPIPQGDVLIYCTPWCPDCRAAKAFLKSLNVNYIEVDIARNRAAANRLRGWTGGKEITPCFEIRGKVLVEFNKAEVEKLLREESLI